MQIVECNPETVAGLLKKNVEKFWLADSRDAYIQFTDGSVVCVHVLDYKRSTYVALDGREETEAANNRTSSTTARMFTCGIPRRVTNTCSQHEQCRSTSMLSGTTLVTLSSTQPDSMSRLLNFTVTKKERHGSEYTLYAHLISSCPEIAYPGDYNNSSEAPHGPVERNSSCRRTSWLSGFHPDSCLLLSNRTKSVRQSGRLRLARIRSCATLRVSRCLGHGSCGRSLRKATFWFSLSRL